MPSDRAKPKRLLRKGTARKQWDNLHPGPIAGKIKPTLVDRELNRYQIRTQTPTEIFTWVRLPSDEQTEAWCVSCPASRHNPKNEACTGIKAAKAMKPSKLYIMKDPKTAIEGNWKRVEYIVAPRYKSGTARFAKLP